jgi:3-phytase
MAMPTSRHLRRAGYSLIALAAAAAMILPEDEPGGFSFAVAPAVETPSMDGSGDVADDPAIWVHPTDASLSVLLGTSKDESQGGLYAYTLDGDVLGKYASGKMLNNTDLRYDFPLGNETIDIVGATNRTDNTFLFFGMDPVSRELIHVGSIAVTLQDPYGFCMYRSSVDGSYYAIGTDTSGNLEQYKLDGRSGSVTGQLVRKIRIGGVAEGCVADEEHRALYIGEEEAALWNYGAEPESGSIRTKVDDVAGNLAADIEGVAIYRTSRGRGYIIVSSQRKGTLQVYDRISKVHLGQFQITASGTGIDGVTATDGVAASSRSFNGHFPNGVLIAHDGDNQGGATSNFKLVPWDAIAVSAGLVIDTSYDPRAGGGERNKTTLRRQRK